MQPNCVSRARMAELVDAPASGAGAGNGVEVRVLFRAPFGLKALMQTVRVYQTLIVGNMNSYPDEAVI